MSGNNGGDNQDNKEKKENKEEDELSAQLESAIITEKPNVKWDDVAGLEVAKQSLREAVVLPLHFPDLFTGKRKPWKGILLYGPPGTGKSYLAKAVATEVNSTFFSVSSSDLMSKWVGQSEKLVKTLFRKARANKPAIIFIDEIDSIAGSRGDNEQEGSRRVKTELLVQMEGVGSDNDKILFLAATNTPWSLDAAVRRRLERRIYISLPGFEARKQMFKIHLGDTPHSITPEGFDFLAANSKGYSGADISIVVRDALMQPIRRLQNATHFREVSVRNSETGEISLKNESCSPKLGQEKSLMSLSSGSLSVPKVTIEDMAASLFITKPSVSNKDIEEHIKWTKEFGKES